MQEYCDKNGKVKYKSPQEAYRYGQRIKNHRGGNVRAYRCQWCGAYHLTSKHETRERTRTLHKKGK